MEPESESPAETGPEEQPDAVWDKPPDLQWVLMNEHGLRAGWSLVVFALLYRMIYMVLGMIALGIDPGLAKAEFTASIALVGELVPLLALVCAGLLVARMEQRTILDYNLRGPRRVRRFAVGMGFGFVALSALVGALGLGGWLHFGPVALSGTALCGYAALWGLVFLLVGFFEEGAFRCYLQATLTRAINFWLAAAIVGTLCLDVLLRSRGGAGVVAYVWMSRLSPLHGPGVWGLYAFALAGFFPCLALHLKRKGQSDAFWQAAWVTSTFFGYVHTTNSGENWIGIFAAAAIGFVFCVSVRLTGSAWWAIGCHAAWDWAESFFYGTADSGMQAKGHFLASAPAGNALWSGGADGPEGSLLVLVVIALLLVGVVAMYGRKTRALKAA